MGEVGLNSILKKYCLIRPNPTTPKNIKQVFKQTVQGWRTVGGVPGDLRSGAEKYQIKQVGNLFNPGFGRAHICKIPVKNNVFFGKRF